MAPLSNAACAVGNSSSFIREGSYLGTPAVLVGNRQQGREHGKNVLNVDYNTQEIIKAIKYQLNIKKYEEDTIFGSGNAGKMISNYLSKVNPPIQKQITY